MQGFPIRKKYKYNFKCLNMEIKIYKYGNNKNLNVDKLFIDLIIK